MDEERKKEQKLVDQRHCVRSLYLLTSWLATRADDGMKRAFGGGENIVSFNSWYSCLIRVRQNEKLYFWELTHLACCLLVYISSIVCDTTCDSMGLPTTY